MEDWDLNALMKTFKQKSNAALGRPGPIAVARFQTGDLLAGLLLFRLRWRWGMSKKLERFGREWIAMSRRDWAMEAGLTESEMKNRALPRLRQCDFVIIRQMKLTPSGPKLLWMSLELSLLPKISDMPWDIYEHKFAGGHVIGDEQNGKITKKQ